MDTWAILVVISILAGSALGALWQTRTSRRDPDWRQTLVARWADEEAIRRYDEQEAGTVQSGLERDDEERQERREVHRGEVSA